MSERRETDSSQAAADPVTGGSATTQTGIPVPNPAPAAALDINAVVTPGTPETASPAAQTPAGTEAYDLKLAYTRESIAFFLLWITAGVIGAAAVATVVFSGWCWLNVRSCQAAGTALDLLSRNMSQYVTAMIGLVGSVVGFYFGSNSRSNTTSSGTGGGQA